MRTGPLRADSLSIVSLEEARKTTCELLPGVCGPGTCVNTNATAQGYTCT